MEISELKKIIEKEKAVFGFNETARLAKKNQIEEVLIASNCPEEMRTNLSEMKLKVQNSEKTNTELAALCKKPFSISVMGIKK